MDCPLGDKCLGLRGILEDVEICITALLLARDEEQSAPSSETAQDAYEIALDLYTREGELCAGHREMALRLFHREFSRNFPVMN